VVEQKTEVKAALIIGCVGLVAAIAGGAITAVATSRAATTQATAAAEQSKASFLRDQQKDAYATFVGSHEALIDAEGDAYYSTVPGWTGISVVDAINRRQEAQQKFGESFTIVSLVGSAPAVGLAACIKDAHDDWDDEYIRYLMLLNSLNPKPDARSDEDKMKLYELTKPIFAANDRLREDGPKFVEQARLDVGAGVAEPAAGQTDATGVCTASS
jgi:hypothetical protein